MLFGHERRRLLGGKNDVLVVRQHDDLIGVEGIKRGNKLLGGGVIGYIGGIAFGFYPQGCQFLLHRFHGAIARAAAESHVAALLGEPYGNGVSDAAGGSGDDGCLVF